MILESERMHLEIPTVIAFHKVKPWGIPNSWGNDRDIMNLWHSGREGFPSLFPFHFSLLLSSPQCIVITFNT